MTMYSSSSPGHNVASLHGDLCPLCDMLRNDNFPDIALLDVVPKHSYMFRKGKVVGKLERHRFSKVGFHPIQCLH